MAIQAVSLEKSYRLLNHGATVLVSAKHGDVENVMAASWACALEFSPAKVTVVLDKSTFTRALVEQSEWFALQVPIAHQAQMVVDVGTDSMHDFPDKLQRYGVKLFYQNDYPIPLVEGCAGWLVCKLIAEPHNQQVHDLFIGDVVAAWADDRIFKDGHWHFDEAPNELKTLHYVAGGQFYLTGAGLKVNKGP
ncbi:flavin reductase family protein [Acinetobacter sp. A3.8]|uniref:Flavin reductase family protein n=1 Tax=Acinetobacter sedimenti TaxID=2919922 RepID=A0A9X2B9B1_9GAMM|nr:flavin reductase family protein [Acinetobacter sedimenti]MCJ8147024.1 flavin reductase family protein [Acinetobacter sedimenti]